MRPRSVVLTVAAAGLLVVLCWAAVAPIDTHSRDQIFEIPKGTWARRMAGDKVEILPDHIRLTVGVRDVLVLRNHDSVPQIFGPTLMMPGQSFRLPFEQPAVYTFSCTAHASGQMIVSVDAFPANALARIAWRAREWWWRAHALTTHF